MSGTAFYEAAMAMQWQSRDSLALAAIQSGAVPDFLLKLQPVHTTIVDSVGKQHRITFYVTPDYLSIGTNADWARIPLTPMAATTMQINGSAFCPRLKW